MAYTSRKRILRDQSVLGIFLGAQYSGVSVTRLSQVPDEILDDASDRFDLQGVPGVVQELCDHSADPEYDTMSCLRTLKEVLTKMTNYEARRNQEDSGVEEEQQKYAKLFVDYGGVEVLSRLIMFTAVLPDESIYSREPEAQLRVKSVCLEILCRLISTEQGEELAASLTKHEDILNYMFTLLTYDKTCLTACQFLEDMLQARRQVLNLNNISNLKNLISYLDDQKLANFCRVLAVTISDLDIYENKSSLFAQNKQKRTKGFVNIRDINQELLLGIPDLLPRLINIACMKNCEYTPRYPGMVSELDCWMEWIENSMSDAAFDMPDEDDMEEFIGGISVAPTPGAPMVQQSGLKISTDLILRVQVVYVLGLFLVGKHRKKVQRKLAELQLVPGLSELFDQFIWKCQGHRNNSRHRLRGHNASCECSPEVALKIQFLRLVHSFCDHSDYKHLLLSRSELNEIKRINAKAGPLTIDGIDCINRQLMCKGSKGLLTKIVEVMKKEPTASTFRFWLARAVESYLRGSTSYCDQVFLLRRGLLQHIAGNIVDHEIRPKEILQSSFDLLGEMVKFNVEAFHAFDKVLNTKAKFDKFIATVNQNLVDSNMFIRSLILSLEHFRNVQPEHREFSEKESSLLKHVGNFNQQMGYLRRLINLINVQNLTQENVSCLNTTLVFLMFANQKNMMPRYLRALAYETSSSSDQCTNVAAPIMKNFRDLLMFWQDHYLHKDKDCSALEKSSRISFEYWKQSVNTLVSEDRNLENAIIHYMDPDTGRDS
jgi:Trpc4-associated protein